MIKDILDWMLTSARTKGGESSHFLIVIGLLQGFALCPYLFVLLINGLLRHVQDEVSWCKLFAVEIFLIDDTKARTNYKIVI